MAKASPAAAAALERIERQHGLWRGRGRSHTGLRAEPSGFAVLDANLPGGGWPRAALTELLGAADGRGALGLALPAAVRLGGGGRLLVLVAPPYRPYAPALAAEGVDLSRVLVVRNVGEREQCWALEQSLRSGACAMVLAWVGELGMSALRRLQLAAEVGDCLGFLFRPAAAARQLSPAALRLRVHPRPGGLAVDILKSRGGWAGARIQLPCTRH